MLYCPLTSGSKGNSHLIAGDNTAVLVDAGTNAKYITQALARIDMTPADITGILITHEHIDHIAALPVLLKKYPDITVYANYGTACAVSRITGIDEARFCIFETGQSFYINELDITPFKTPHDAAESVGYGICCGTKKVAVATDIGHMTRTVLTQLEDAQLVCLEANHDKDMLLSGKYPLSLKSRILGKNGHLSNDDCGKTLAYLSKGVLKQAVLAHLSQENNTPELARETVLTRLEETGVRDLPLDIAMQNECGCCYRVETI